MAIYTRTGDAGKTSLFGGKRVLKSETRVEAYGTLDELNSILGVANALVKDLKEVSKEIEKIQHDLFSIGSYLATPHADALPSLEKRVKEFEKIIDKHDTVLSPLTFFILPSGSVAGAHMHYARTVARRAERKIVKLLQEEEIDMSVLRYINRLSDLLFSTARYINFIEKKEEIRWKK